MTVTPPETNRRTTRRRAAVEKALAGHAVFVSAQELHGTMSESGVRVGLTTVYRALQALEQSGAADVVRDEAGERLYRYRRPDAGHCHYLLCRRCRRHEPLDTDAVEEWVAAVVRSSDFADVEHTLELTGVCAGCRAARARHSGVAPSRGATPKRAGDT
ncbi:transcriptional repressor [Streptomyces globosus]|uniref:Transcriptional repressor n=1 Tax=Streptomyces globosus TaxID=68209 RepID=A0A344TZN7_9ACTN|nr:transcriptional repressor [Streptomyces globosus]AXE24108.1 transcriptional repressor [Streptomyces globosus]